MKRSLIVRWRWAAVALIASVTSALTMQPIQADTLDDAIAESTARAPSPIVARAAMIERRAIDSVRLSPDGQSLAYVIEQGRRRALWLFDTISQDHSLLLTSKLLDDIYWSADSQYIFVTSAQGCQQCRWMRAKHPVLS